MPVTRESVLRRFADEPSIQGFLPFIERDIVPFDYFHVYRDWLRMQEGKYRLRVLFIAEAPPWRALGRLPSGDVRNYRYFFNDACRAPASLRTMMLSRLDITRSAREELRLPIFRDHHLFLTDTIKCAFRKDVHPTIPSSLVQVGAEILREEITWLRPRYIVAMGFTAYAAIRQIFPRECHGFRRLSDLPTALIAERILVMPYPNMRNRGNFGNRLDASFAL
ncbi:MAG: uracil-DNA glycosylase family protein, partial [Methanomicrobiales archaeon]|nr:uracil-DNA glycosylase family protein [Methanomicrobiales archaeon]